jgi:hypothetical protein
MYRCDVCDSVVPANTPCNRITIETRVVEYPMRPKVHWIPPKDGGKGKWIDDPGGRGTRIVRELRACPPCAAAAAANDQPPRLIAAPERNVPVTHKPTFPCACCGYLTLSEAPGSFEICWICFWEDDIVQLQFPMMAGGANRVSLIEGQRNFAAIGASEARMREHCRPPSTTDARDASWRPVDLQTDNIEALAPEVVDHVRPADGTALYYWRETYWRR